jgi:hypothetical protein
MSHLPALANMEANVNTALFLLRGVIEDEEKVLLERRLRLQCLKDAVKLLDAHQNREFPGGRIGFYLLALGSLQSRCALDQAPCEFPELMKVVKMATDYLPALGLAPNEYLETAPISRAVTFASTADIEVSHPATYQESHQDACKGHSSRKPVT